MRHGPLQHLGVLGSIQTRQYPLYAETHSPLSGHQEHRRLRRHLYWIFTAVSVVASVARNVYGISEIMVKMNSIMFQPLNGSKYSQDPELAEDWTEKELAGLEYA